MVVALRQDVSVRAKEMVITPAMAADWLKKVAPNRRLSENAINRYAKDMREGRWDANGSTIVMGRSGKILDGQHRLNAIIKAEIPISMIVVSGVADESFRSIDTGRARSVSDVLRAMGIASNVVLAATARQWLVYERYGVFSETYHKEFSSQEVLTCALEHQSRLLEAINATALCNQKLRGSAGVWACLWVIFGSIDEQDRDTFFAALTEGANLRVDSPIFVLRRYMLEHRRTRERGLSVLPAMLGALAIKAWNRYRAHEPIRMLAWRADESYPVPQ